MASDVKERLKELVEKKDELQAQKAKLEAKLEIAEKELSDIKDELELMFGTTDTKELAKIKQDLLTEAENLLNERADDDE